MTSITLVTGYPSCCQRGRFVPVCLFIGSNIWCCFVVWSMVGYCLVVWVCLINYYELNWSWWGYFCWKIMELVKCCCLLGVAIARNMYGGFWWCYVIWIRLVLLWNTRLYEKYYCASMPHKTIPYKPIEPLEIHITIFASSSSTFFFFFGQWN